MASTPQPPSSDASKRSPGRRRPSILAKENRRLLYGLVIGALTAAFAVVNLDEVEVNWLLGTWETPLIIVIAVSFVLGAIVGWFAGATRRKAKSETRAF
jgi:uncharacterized integral membrane protein